MTWRTRRTASGTAIEPMRPDYDRGCGGNHPQIPDPYGTGIESIEDVVAAAVVEAVKNLAGDGVTVVGSLNINVNIQLASGGGATNVVGEHKPVSHYGGGR